VVDDGKKVGVAMVYVAREEKIDDRNFLMGPCAEGTLSRPTAHLHPATQRPRLRCQRARMVLS
jgi:hypothetical protein